MKVVNLLRTYATNLVELEADLSKVTKLKKKLTSRLHAKLELVRHQLMVQRDIVLHGVENIIACELKYMSRAFVKENDQLANEEVFKVIRTYNLVLERLKRSLEPDEDADEDEKVEAASSVLPCTSNLAIPGTSTQKPPDPPPLSKPSVEKIKIILTPDAMVSPTSNLKKFTASKILQNVGSVRCGQVTEFVTEALLSRVAVPFENSTNRIHYPWKPVSHLVSSLPNSCSHVDIFEEALAKEEDENRLNQKKLDWALRQEFGEDFPGTDYLPSSEGDALKPICSKNMDAFIKTNTAFLELLFKKFLNTPGVLVPALVKTGKYGELRLSKAGKSRLEGYYVDQIWGVGSNLVDELVLWSPLIIKKESRSHSYDGNETTVTTPSSAVSDSSSASSAATTVVAGETRTVNVLPVSGGVVTGKKSHLVTLKVDPKMSWNSSAVCHTFLAPPALNTSHLLYLQDNFTKFIRRGVLPGWCIDSCDGLASEARHLATQSYLDRHLVIGLGAYARRAPGAVKLPDGNYSTNGGVGLCGAVELLVWQINQIEKTEVENEGKDWPITDLVEYLNVLCSICSSSLCWLQLRSECLLNTWTTAPYYLLTQADLPHLLLQLAKMNIEEREHLNKTDDLQRAVLVPYREKLVTKAEALLAFMKVS